MHVRVAFPPARVTPALAMVRSASARAFLTLTALLVASSLTLHGCAPIDDSDEGTAAVLADIAGSGAGAAEHVIVVLGSSTAAGFGPAPGELAWVDRYRAHLQNAFPGFEVVNLAAGGATTFDIQPSDWVAPANRPQPAHDRNITQALTHRPDAIIVNMPSNDQQGGHTLDEQLANYERVVARASASGVAVWVTTTQPRNFTDEAQRTALMAARDAITARFGDHSIDVWSPFAQWNGTIDPRFDSGDGVHLNGAAHDIFAQRVIAARIPERVLAGH